MASGDMRQTIKELEALQMELFGVASAENTARVAGDNLGRSQGDLSNAVDGAGDSIEEQSGRLGRLTGSLKENNKQIQMVGKSYMAAGAAMMAFSGLAAIPIKFAGAMDKSFGTAFKSVGDFQNQIFLTSQRMTALGSNMGSLTGVQAGFKKGIDDITKSTFLSTQSSTKVFSSLLNVMEGAKGSVDEVTGKFTGQAKAMETLSTKAGQLGGDLAEVERITNSLGQAVTQFVEIQKMMEELDTGGLTAGSQATLMLMEKMNPQFKSQVDEMMKLNENAGRGAARAVRGEAFVRGRETQQARESSELEVQRELVQRSFPQLTQQMAKSTYQHVQASADVYAGLVDLGKKLEMAGAATTFVGGGIASAGAAASGTLGTASKYGSMLAIGAGMFGKGRLGGMARMGGGAMGMAGLASGDVTKVWVMNTVPIPVSMGPGGGMFGPGGRSRRTTAGRGGLTPAQRLARRGAARGGAGAAARGMGRSIPLLGVALTAGFAYSDYKAEKEALKSKKSMTESERKQAAGLVAGGGAAGALTGAAAGAAIGSLVPVIGTIVGGAVGGALGYYGGEKAGSWAKERMFGDKIREGKEEEIIEEDKKSTAQKQVDSIMKAWREGIQEVHRELSLTVKTAEFRGGTAAMVAGAAAMGGVGFAGLEAQEMRKQIEELDIQAAAKRKVAAAEASIIPKLKEQKAILEKQYEAIKETGTAEEIRTASAEVFNKETAIQAAITMESRSKAEALTMEMKAFTMSLSQAVKEQEAVTKIAESKAGLLGAVQSFHQALRLGIPASYEDKIKTTEALYAVAQSKRAEAAELMAEYRRQETEGEMTDAKAKTAKLMIQEKLTAATQADTKALEEAKAVREGYLDAIKSEVFGFGAYTELVAKRGSGQQFFAPSFATGDVGRSENMAPGEYTRGGLVFGDKAGLTRQTEKTRRKMDIEIERSQGMMPGTLANLYSKDGGIPQSTMDWLNYEGMGGPAPGGGVGRSKRYGAILPGGDMDPYQQSVYGQEAMRGGSGTRFGGYRGGRGGTSGTSGTGRFSGISGGRRPGSSSKFKTDPFADSATSSKMDTGDVENIYCKTVGQIICGTGGAVTATPGITTPGTTTPGTTPAAPGTVFAAPVAAVSAGAFAAPGTPGALGAPGAPGAPTATGTVAPVVAAAGIAAPVAAAAVSTAPSTAQDLVSTAKARTAAPVAAAAPEIMTKRNQFFSDVREEMKHPGMKKYNRPGSDEPEWYDPVKYPDITPFGPMNLNVGREDFIRNRKDKSDFGDQYMSKEKLAEYQSDPARYEEYAAKAILDSDEGGITTPSGFANKRFWDKRERKNITGVIGEKREIPGLELEKRKIGPTKMGAFDFGTSDAMLAKGYDPKVGLSLEEMATTASDPIARKKLVDKRKRLKLANLTKKARRMHGEEIDKGTYKYFGTSSYGMDTRDIGRAKEDVYDEKTGEEISNRLVAEDIVSRRAGSREIDADILKKHGLAGKKMTPENFGMWSGARKESTARFMKSEEGKSDVARMTKDIDFVEEGVSKGSEASEMIILLKGIRGALSSLNKNTQAQSNAAPANKNGHSSAAPNF